MAWKCPDCGHDANADTDPRCRGCGYMKMPSALVLTAASTGKQVAMTLDTTVGKYLLQSLVNDDYRFAAEKQFTIIKNKSVGKWIIKHEPGATNPTFYQGSALAADEQGLDEGGIISIGPDKAKLTVSFKP